MLWFIFRNIIIENEVVVIDRINKMIVERMFQLIRLDINIISLKVLMVGGAEILMAI